MPHFLQILRQRSRGYPRRPKILTFKKITGYSKLNGNKVSPLGFFSALFFQTHPVFRSPVFSMYFVGPIHFKSVKISLQMIWHFTTFIRQYKRFSEKSPFDF